MSKVIRVAGYVFIFLVVFYLGFAVGEQPSEEELADIRYRTEVNGDLYTISYNYKTLTGLCEDKYQAALKGNWSQAYQIKGQMDALWTQTEQIVSKYNVNPL